ncbi:MAG: type II secretion system protein [Phycisphaeraceae bacterium]
MQRVEGATQRWSRGGWSLIELVMVLSIISVISAIAVPRYTGAVSRYRGQAAANQVVRMLELAQTSARQRSSSVSVWFDVADNSVRVPELDDPDRDGAWVVYLSDRPWRASLAKADFDSQSHVAFDGYGETDRGGTVAIDAGGTQWEVVLDQASGRVAIGGF